MTMLTFGEDIRIVKRRDRAVIVGVTEKGNRWIKSNQQRIDGDPAIIINSEFAEEWANDVRKEGLIVEIE